MIPVGNYVKCLSSHVSLSLLNCLDNIIKYRSANIHPCFVKKFSFESAIKDVSHSPLYLNSSDKLTVTDEKLSDRNVIICKNFITEEEEQCLLAEIEPAIKRLRYQIDHWDDAIHGYRETEKANWSPENSGIIERIKKFAFPPGSPTLKLVHVLDLSEDGFIKPHVDSVRFCGHTVAGLSLLTNSVMRFVCSKNQSLKIDVILPRRSLYVMRDEMRYEFTHEILSNENSFFNGEKVHKLRRISVICRNDPPSTDM